MWTAPRLLSNEIDRWEAVLLFATERHGGQLRKYTGEPYVHHVANVASIVSRTASRSMEMIEAAVLHDTLEDTDTKAEELRARFGPTVTGYVILLTDPDKSVGNRATRKEIVCERMLTAPWQVKTIKLADVIDNSKSIFEHDPSFAKVYANEKAMLLNHLLGGDQDLWNEASSILCKYFEQQTNIA